MIPLISFLEKLEDPRKARGKRYNLVSILVCCFIATICGYTSYSGYSDFCNNYKDSLSEILDLKRIPCPSTFFNILKDLKVNNFEKLISEWIEQYLSNSECVSIDGKTLRGTKKQGGDYYHLLSAFSHSLGITLYQSPVDSKTNEIKGIIELLKGVTIKGKVFTMDALLTQKDIAKKIIKEQGDYVMIAKENQSFLMDDIDLLIEFNNNVGQTENYTKTEKGHGRIETRKITLTNSDDIIEWHGVKKVFMIERWIKRNGKETYEKVFGLTSLEANSEKILSLVRGHWSIENRSHWVRDVTFKEDFSQVKNSNIAQIMAMFRNTAIAIIRINGFNNIAKATRFYASNPSLALKYVTQ